jgi:hypothetical protein
VKTDELTRTQIVTCSYTDLVLQYSETILTVGNYSLTESMIYFCRCILSSITAGVVYKGSQKRGEIRCALEHAYEENGQHGGTSSELQRVLPHVEEILGLEQASRRVANGAGLPGMVK